MTNLEVSFGEQLVANGGQIPDGQLLENLDILWNTVRGYNYYALKIENIDSRKLYFFDIDIYDHTDGGRKRLISPQRVLPSGTYRVTLYGQPEILGSKKVEDVNEGELESLQTLTFVSGPVTYGRSFGKATMRQSSSPKGRSFGSPKKRSPSPKGRSFGSPKQRSPSPKGRSYDASLQRRRSPSPKGHLYGKSPQRSRSPSLKGSLYGKSPRRRSPSPKGSLYGQLPKRERSPSPSRSGRGRSPSRSLSSDPRYQAISGHRERGRYKEIVSASIPEDHRKFCGCIVSVAVEQSPECLSSRRWHQRIEGKQCYSPIPVCSSSLRTSPIKPCYQYYLFDKMTDAELVAVALEHDVPLPAPWNGEGYSKEERKQLLKSLKSKKK